ncbi:hypothetical protein PAQ90_003273 [Vibrio parahaemolyticus]|nr:hypothetical protein [Vibrio parahaemolyticus]EJV0282218.1 hypothetical protein [Vibrio parahaemolyticus]EKH9206756.1 hypothetical protein [Vibrio parahaemolyticus]
MSKEIEKKNKSDRTERITVRLSPENKRYLNNLKTQFEFESFEDLIMSFVNEQFEHIESKKTYIDTDGECLNVLKHLNKFSTNLNQLAKIANKNGKLSDSEMNKFKNYQTQLIKARNHLSKNVMILKGKL